MFTYKREKKTFGVVIVIFTPARVTANLTYLLFFVFCEITLDFIKFPKGNHNFFK